MEKKNNNMAITARGLRLMLAGVVVMLAGYILMIGGGSDNPQVFNYAMFDFQRTVAAPIVIIAGVIVVIAGIMSPGRGKDGEGAK